MSKKKKKHKNINYGHKKNTTNDPIGILITLIKDNWKSIFKYLAPLSLISVVIIKITRLHLYKIPYSFIFPMIKPSWEDIINSAILMMFTFVFIITIEIVRRVIKHKIWRVAAYLLLSFSITKIFSDIMDYNSFITTMISLFLITGVFIYLKLIRIAFEKQSRDLAERAYRSSSIKWRKAIFSIEMFGLILGYLTILFFCANILTILPQNHATIDGKLILASSYDKLLVCDYSTEKYKDKVDYLLIKTDEMEIVKGGVLNILSGPKTIIRGEKWE